MQLKSTPILYELGSCIKKRIYIPISIQNNGTSTSERDGSAMAKPVKKKAVVAKVAKKKILGEKKKVAVKATTQGHHKKIHGKIVDLYKKNKELQMEINKTKKKYEQLEKESLKLTKELMEAGYIPKDLTLAKK